MKVALTFAIESRDGTLNKDAKLVNVYMADELGRKLLVTRPGISTAIASVNAVGDGLSEGYVFTSTTFGQVSYATVLSTAYYSSTQQSTFSFITPYNLGNGWGLVADTSSNQAHIWNHATRLSTGSWTDVTTYPTIALGPYPNAYTFKTTTVIVGLSPGSNLNILSSSDQSTWSVYTLSWPNDGFIPAPVTGLTDNGTEFLAYSSSGVRRTSTPGLSSGWTSQTLSGKPSDLGGGYAVCLNTTTFWVGGTSVSNSAYSYPTVYKSTDGSTFALHQSSAAWGATPVSGAVNYSSRIWVLQCEYDGSIWHSTDVSSFTSLTTTLFVSTKKMSGNDADGILVSHSAALYLLSLDGIVNGTNLSTLPIGTISNPNDAIVSAISTP